MFARKDRMKQTIVFSRVVTQVDAAILWLLQFPEVRRAAGVDDDFAIRCVSEPLLKNEWPEFRQRPSRQEMAEKGFVFLPGGPLSDVDPTTLVGGSLFTDLVSRSGLLAAHPWLTALVSVLSEDNKAAEEAAARGICPSFLRDRTPHVARTLRSVIEGTAMLDGPVEALRFGAGLLRNLTVDLLLDGEMPSKFVVRQFIAADNVALANGGDYTELAEGALKALENDWLDAERDYRGSRGERIGGMVLVCGQSYSRAFPSVCRRGNVEKSPVRNVRTPAAARFACS
jgi:hypothetical protein